VPVEIGEIGREPRALVVSERFSRRSSGKHAAIVIPRRRRTPSAERRV
jgi:hypothetical protein